MSKEWTWRSLNEILNLLTETEVLAMLNKEKKGLKRKPILVRLHQRYSALRMQRERKELTGE